MVVVGCVNYRGIWSLRTVTIIAATNRGGSWQAVANVTATIVANCSRLSWQRIRLWCNSASQTPRRAILHPVLQLTAPRMAKPRPCTEPRIASQGLRTITRTTLTPFPLPLLIPQSPIPIPHSPIPNPQSPFPIPQSPFPVPRSPPTRRK